MPLSPAAQGFIDLLLAGPPAPPLADLTPGAARAAVAPLFEMSGPAPRMAEVESLSLPVAGGRIEVRTLTPPGDIAGTLVFIHGGGWLLGTARQHDAVAAQMAEATGCRVVVPCYRLAPEHPFPVPVEDCWTALLHTAARFPSEPLFLAGDSAGGNLAAVMTHRARAARAPAIAGQVLVYPVTDFDPARGSWADPAHALLLDAPGMLWYWSHYIADPAQRLHPEASPLRATDFTGLPPALVITAEYDILRDEGEAYAEALRAAGVPVDVVRYPGEIHAFLVLGAHMPAAAEAMQAIGGFVRRVQGG